MKRVVSVSIGSSKRDHRVQTKLLGEDIVIERIGTDGDLERAGALIAELDGKVDAFGLGGLDLYIYAGGRRYAFRDAKKLVARAKTSPVVDGSGLKNSLERWVVQYLNDELDLNFAGKRVLMVAAVDRFGMAEALVDAGCDMVFGDMIFALGVPVPLRTLKALNRVARTLLPVLTQLPFKMLYPTGDKQDATEPKHAKFYEWADIVAGDFHFIKRFMPTDLTGKVILTNTVTAADVELLKERGVSLLITTTPNLEGRSFGTNVMEAALVALSGKEPTQIGPSDYLTLLDRIGFRPRVEVFRESSSLSPA